VPRSGTSDLGGNLGVLAMPHRRVSVGAFKWLLSSAFYMPTATGTFFKEFYFYWFIVETMTNGRLLINFMFSALAMSYRIVQTFMLSAAMMDFMFIFIMMDMMK